MIKGGWHLQNIQVNTISTKKRKVKNGRKEKHVKGSPFKAELKRDVEN